MFKWTIVFDENKEEWIVQDTTGKYKWWSTKYSHVAVSQCKAINNCPGYFIASVINSDSYVVMRNSDNIYVAMSTDLKVLENFRDVKNNRTGKPVKFENAWYIEEPFTEPNIPYTLKFGDYVYFVANWSSCFRKLREKLTTYNPYKWEVVKSKDKNQYHVINGYNDCIFTGESVVEARNVQIAANKKPVHYEDATNYIMPKTITVDMKLPVNKFTITETGIGDFKILFGTYKYKAFKRNFKREAYDFYNDLVESYKPDIFIVCYDDAQDKHLIVNGYDEVKAKFNARQNAEKFLANLRAEIPQPVLNLWEEEPTAKVELRGVTYAKPSPTFSDEQVNHLINSIPELTVRQKAVIANLGRKG